MVVIGNFTHNFLTELNEPNFEVIEKGEVRLYKTPDGLFPSVTTVTGHENKKKYKNWRFSIPRASSTRDTPSSKIPTVRFLTSIS